MVPTEPVYGTVHHWCHQEVGDCEKNKEQPDWVIDGLVDETSSAPPLSSLAMVNILLLLVKNENFLSANANCEEQDILPIHHDDGCHQNRD